MLSFDHLRYELTILGRRALFLPHLVLGVFLLVAWSLHLLSRGDPTRVLSACLEIMLPLVVGILVAWLSSDDPATEIQLTLPGSYRSIVLTRTLLLVAWSLGIMLLASVMIYGLHLWWSPHTLGPWPEPWRFLFLQLPWLAPLLWFASAGLCLAQLTRSRVATSALLAGLWMIEILTWGYFAKTSWLHPLFLFSTTLSPDLDFWLVDCLEVLGIAALLCPLSWYLLGRSERLLTTAQEA